MLKLDTIRKRKEKREKKNIEVGHYIMKEYDTIMKELDTIMKELDTI